MTLLSSAEIHVWSIDTASIDLAFDFAYSLLSDSEKLSADRFHREIDRQRYVFSHAACRMVLASYLEIRPKEIDYSREKNNKPCLSEVSGLHFNLSHSHEMALIAVAKQSVGVDIEWCERDVGSLQVAKRYFTAAEYRLISSSSPADRVSLFFRAWTLKEAYLKARGVGLVHGMDTFELNLALSTLKNNNDTNWLASSNAIDDSVWWLQSIPSALSYVAAVSSVRPVSVIKPYFFHSLPDFSDIFC